MILPIISTMTAILFPMVCYGLYMEEARIAEAKITDEILYKSRRTQKLDVERIMGKPTQAVEIDWEIENPDEIVEFEFEQPSYIHTEGKIYQKQTVIAFEDGELVESDYHYKPIYIEHEQPSYEIPTMKLSDKYITFDSLVDQPCYSEYCGNKWWLRSCNRDSRNKEWTCIGTHYRGR